MTFQWMMALGILDTRVDDLLDEVKDENPDNFQLYIDFWKSVSKRSLIGKLTHLPTKKVAPVRVRLPI